MVSVASAAAASSAAVVSSSVVPVFAATSESGRCVQMKYYGLQMDLLHDSF